MCNMVLLVASAKAMGCLLACSKIADNSLSVHKHFSSFDDASSVQKKTIISNLLNLSV
jgi:hypothetical protein